MARYIPSAMTGALVGSLGGDTFSKNRYGYYVKKKAIPTNPNTANQAEIRSIMTDLVSYWKSDITASEAESWRHAAELHQRSKYGASFSLSGFNLFCGFNLLSVLAGVAIVDAPTLFDGAPSCVLPTVTTEAVTGKLEISAWSETDVNIAGFFYSTNAVAESINYKNSAFTFRQIVNVAGAFPHLIDVDYPASGKNYKIFCGFRTIKTGGGLSNLLYTDYSGTMV